jgi:hypothetical protein
LSCVSKRLTSSKRIKSLKNKNLRAMLNIWLTLISIRKFKTSNIF